MDSAVPSQTESTTLDSHRSRRLAREERHLQIALIAGAVLFALEAVIYIPQVFQGPAATAASTRDGNHVMCHRDPLSGAEIDFTPSTSDLATLLGGLRHAGQLLLDAGAEYVMPATFAYHELRTSHDLARLHIGDLVHDASDISVNTGHLQGGNPISRDAKRGVIDEMFRIHGFENLHVCDASAPDRDHSQPTTHGDGTGSLRRQPTHEMS